MTRAKKIVQAVGDLATVTINAEKPGRGNFVVHLNGTPVIELLAMNRPFPALKALDMDEVSQKIVSMIQDS